MRWTGITGWSKRPVQPDDNYLTERVKSGDSAAFEQLFRKYEHRLLNFFHKLCFNQALAEDLLQETFLRLWRSRHSLRPGAGKFSTYLFQIGKNCWISHSQTRKYQSQAGAAEIGEVPDTGPHIDPGALAESSELQEKLRDAISSLPEEQRIPFVLSRYEGLTYDEIAQVLAVSSRTVERRVTEAARQLARRLIGK